MKKFILAIIFFINISYAQYVNGLIAVVEDEPITNFDLEQTISKMGVSPSEALSLLIRHSLEKSQIKSLSIDASEFEVDQNIERLANENGMSVETFKSIVRSRGISQEQFRNDMRDDIKRDKLYARILDSASQNINPENAKRFYEANKNMFMEFKTINVSRYISQDRNSLDQIVRSPMSVQNGVNISSLSLEAAELNPQLKYIFVHTKSNSFTPILQNKNGFEMFYIISKDGSYLPEFKDIENEVIKAMAAREQETAVADYFDKLRAKANIEIIKR